MNAETYKAIGFVGPEGTDGPYRCEKVRPGEFDTLGEAQKSVIDNMRRDKHLICGTTEKSPRGAPLSKGMLVA